MSQLRINTRYRLTLYFNKQVLMQFYNSNPNYNIDFDVNITKDALAQGNCRSNMFIYNLSQDKIGTLQSLVAQGRQTAMNFMIEVSLNNNQDQYQILSYDDVIGIYTELGEGDYKTNIILKSGEGQLVSVYSSASYAAATKLSTVVETESQKLVDGMSIISTSNSDLIDYTFPYGTSYSGSVYNYLKKMCYESNNTLFVDKGIVYAAQNSWLDKTAVNTRTLDFSNGLLEPPSIGQLNYPRRKNKKQSTVSFQFKSLLLPELSINNVISVLGVNYTVKRINHTINSREGLGYSVIEGFKNDSI